MTHSILFLGSQMAIGGAQRMLLQQAQWFQAQGYRVCAAFLYDKEGFEEQWRKTYQIPLVNLKARQPTASSAKNFLLLIGGLWRAWRLMRRERFDAIATFTHHSNFTILLAWLAGIRLRVAIHPGRIQGFPLWLERLHAWVVNRFATCLVASSKRVRQESVQEGVQPQKIRVVHNGTSLPAVQDFDRSAYRRQLGTSDEYRILDEHLLVLSVGRLTEQKAHTYLIQAAPAVLACCPSARFAIAGDGPLRDALAAEIRQYGLQEVFLLLGARQDIPQLLSASDVFALPSRSEGLPLALLEAMSTGLSAVATAVEGSEEVITQGETGLLVSPEDPAALAQALCSLLNDREYRNKLARAGQAHVLDQYSLERMCQRMQALLDPKQKLADSTAITSSD